MWMLPLRVGGFDGRIPHPMLKTKNKFPYSLSLREKVLEDWLHKASFWAQVLQYLIEDSRIRCMCMYVD